MTEARKGQEQFVSLGAITRAHGLRGEVRVKLFNPASDLVLESRAVLLRRDGVVAERRIVAARRERDDVLLTFDGVASREAADAMRGYEVGLTRANLPELEEGEYYFVDLEGLRAVSDGVEVGVAKRVVEYPTVSCLLIESAAGAREVPLVEPYFLGADLDRGVVEVAHLEDLELVPKR